MLPPDPGPDGARASPETQEAGPVPPGPAATIAAAAFAKGTTSTSVLRAAATGGGALRPVLDGQRLADPVA
jgi:hypothetical protein